MRYETVQMLKDEEFKRSTGVRRKTFEQMLQVVEAGLRDFGRPTKLCRADQLLMTLMYWREYRTEFHIGLTYGVSESTVCRTIKKVENVLIQSKQFHLSGRKALQPSDTIIEIVLVDATEQPIERPKKDNGGITAVKRSVTPKKRS
jgi:Helix-turn-helix of DDE superfamily endonuclease